MCSATSMRPDPLRNGPSARESVADRARRRGLAAIVHDAGPQASTDCVKKVGATLVKDHERLATLAAPVARKFDVTLPTTPTAAQRAQLAALTPKAGTAAYDAAWLEDQEAGHRAFLTL